MAEATETIEQVLDDLWRRRCASATSTSTCSGVMQADFENYKKRMVRQQTDLLERAAEGLVVQGCCPVLDAFDLARAPPRSRGLTPRARPLLQAVGAARGHAGQGRPRARSSADGAAFDPTVHEAVEHVRACVATTRHLQTTATYAASRW